MSDPNKIKIQVFEEILYHLNEWHKEQNPGKENDLSILKVMKLLFFVSGADSENHLFDVFDKFQAWQYGHVEAEIYDYYYKNEGRFENLTLNRKTTDFSNTAIINSNFSQKISKNVNKLKEENIDLISYEAFRLVDISHSYISWDFYYNKLNKPYQDISEDMLKYEPRYYR
ncbi:hypothetical protein ACILPE_00235 [Capnocytophaga canimorsus]|uniref:hypothetical protein n=1 Tax=Capnocytophaga canimorsus TaxID=28188 RepID=UPI0037D31076